MTKFSDQLFDDLMQEHGHTLASIQVPAPRRHLARPVLLTAGAGGVAAVAAVGALAAGGGTPAYAVTPHANGTVTLAVYQKDGITQANAKLRQIGDSRVVLVPVRPGCPSISSLPGPSKQFKGQISVQGSVSTSGAMTVNARGVPAGDTLVVALETTTANGPGMSASTAKLISGPAPSCVSIPKQPVGGPPGSGTGIVTGGGGGKPGTGGPGTVTGTGGTGKFGTPVHQSGGSGSKPGDGGPGTVTGTGPAGATAPSLS